MTETTILPSGLLAPSVLGRGEVAARPQASWPVRDDSFDLPDLAPCDHLPVLLILLFDNSPSVVGQHDPTGRRFQEAAIALDHYRRRCPCLCQLVAVRTFDLRTPIDVGPCHLEGEGGREISSALATPQVTIQGWSRMGPALRHAQRLALDHPDHRTELVVFSDFKLYDLFPSWVLQRLCRFPGRVHAIVLTAEPPARLLLSPVVVGRITAESEPGAVAQAVVRALEPVR